MAGTLAFQSSSTSTGQTITAPADIIAGDVLFIADMPVSAGAAPADVTPAGFTATGVAGTGTDGAGASNRVKISYKIADGSEASAVITGMNGGASNRKIMLVFRPTATPSAVTPADPDIQVVNTNPAAQVKNASGQAVPLIVLGLYYGNVAPTRDFTPAKDSEVNVSNAGQFYLAWKIYNASPADVTIDMADVGSMNTLGSTYVLVTVPDPPVVAPKQHSYRMRRAA